MAQVPPITTSIVGQLVQDPELRFTASGASVANFTVAANEREFDRQTNEWKDGPTTFMRCTLWREYAENFTESMHKGDRVFVLGRLQQREWETREGERRTVIEMQVDEAGPTLRWHTATVRKTSKGGNRGGGQQQGGQQWGGYNNGGTQADDPWGSSPSGGGFPADDSEPPF